MPAFLIRLLALTFAALAAPALAPPSAHASDTPQASRDTVSVLTLNLYHDKADWPKRRVQIADTLRQLRPDVIALQEVIQTAAVENQAQWLADQLGYQMRFTSTDAPDKVHRYGNALLTPHAIVGHGETKLAPLDDSRTAMKLLLDVRGRRIEAVNTHLHHTDEGAAIREQQVAGLMAFIGSRTDAVPTLVAGDFNTTADAPELALLHERFADSFGVLHPDAGPETTTLNRAWFDTPRRIDHVFFDRGRLLPLRSDILFTQPDAEGTWASDHHAVLSVFGFID